MRMLHKLESDKVIHQYKKSNGHFLEQKKKQMKYIRDLERLTTEEDSRYNHSVLKMSALRLDASLAPLNEYQQQMSMVQGLDWQDQLAFRQMRK